jgi:uncharacterized membrane protein (UPF0127 family)
VSRLKTVMIALVAISLAIVASFIAIERFNSPAQATTITVIMTRITNTSTTTEEKWRTTCLYIGLDKDKYIQSEAGYNAKLYVADRPELHAEGYRNKKSIDFENKSAVGMVFIGPWMPEYPFLSYSINEKTITFTMKDVSFPLVLAIVAQPGAGKGRIVEEIYMEPGKDYKIRLAVSYNLTTYINNKQIPHLVSVYFIELDPAFVRELKQKLNVTSLEGLEVSPCG